MARRGTVDQIATSSVEDALDFACNLLVAPIQRLAKDRPDEAPAALMSLSQYIEFRYVGELMLAFEELAALGADVGARVALPEQFRAQVLWLRGELGGESV
jgi:hypothetical protein